MSARIQHSNSAEAQQQHDIIPGIEHKFFETQLEEMEQQQSGDSNIVVLAVDGSSHSEYAFNCE